MFCQPTNAVKISCLIWSRGLQRTQYNRFEIWTYHNSIFALLLPSGDSFCLTVCVSIDLGLPGIATRPHWRNISKCIRKSGCESRTHFSKVGDGESHSCLPLMGISSSRTRRLKWAAAHFSHNFTCDSLHDRGSSGMPDDFLMNEKFVSNIHSAPGRWLAATSVLLCSQPIANKTKPKMKPKWRYKYWAFRNTSIRPPLTTRWIAAVFVWFIHVNNVYAPWSIQNLCFNFDQSCVASDALIL